MSGAYGNIKGYLYKGPELKQSKSGNGYSSALLKVKDGNETKFWRIMAFKDAAQSLMRFAENDGVQCEGAIKIDTYEKDGTTRVSFTLLANSVDAYSPPERKPQSTVRGATASRSSQTAPFDYLV
jgi:hypothetical protein